MRASKAARSLNRREGVSGLVVNMRAEHYDISIARPSRWGNPFKIGEDTYRNSRYCLGDTCERRAERKREKERLERERREAEERRKRHAWWERSA